MGIRDFFKPEPSLAERLINEKLYEQVLEEIEGGHRRGGLWLQAIESSRGNEREAKLLYIKLRLQSLKDEIALAAAHEDREAQIREQQSRKRAEESDVNHYDENGLTALMRAARDGDVATVKDLLKSDADPHLKDSRFGTSTALSMAKLSRNRTTDELQASRLNEVVEILSYHETGI
ncbi:MAG: hypothetical protein WCE70_00005 [Rhodanobacteraceae bacterium]